MKRGQDDRDAPPGSEPVGANASKLRLLPPEPGPADGDDAPRLVREFKGPTVRGILEAAEEEIDLLPGRVCSMAEAIDDGDFGEADRRFDRAVGRLVAGPGHHDDGYRIMAPAVVWLLVGLAAALAAWLAL